MPTLKLSDDEAAALADHLCRVTAADPFPHSPRLRTLQAILGKLDPVERRAQHGRGQVPPIATGVSIMSGRPKLFEDRQEPGTWRVEWIDADGGCEVAIFAGQNARERAIGYSFERYKDFELISYP